MTNQLHLPLAKLLLLVISNHNENKIHNEKLLATAQSSHADIICVTF